MYALTVLYRICIHNKLFVFIEYIVLVYSYFLLQNIEYMTLASD